MPILASQARASAGQFTTRLHGTSYRPRSAPQPLRIRSRTDLAMVLLLLANVVAARPLLAAAAATARPCTPAPPLSIPVVLHDVASVARSPVESTFGMARTLYYHLYAGGCAPPESAVEHAVLQLADSGVAMLEGALFGPEAPVLIREVADGVDVGADAMQGKPPSRTVLEDMLLSLVGLRAGSFERPAVEPPPLAQMPPLLRTTTSFPMFGRAAQAITRRPALDTGRVVIAPADHEGVHPYRDTVSGREGRAIQVQGAYYRLQAFTADGAVVEGIPLLRQDGRYRLRAEPVQGERAVATDGASEQSSMRCRRAPGAGCGPSSSPYSPALAQVLRRHHAQGVPEALARQRGIAADPLRPGWFVRVSGNSRHQYLHVDGRYFPVKLHRSGGCTRLTLHASHDGLRIGHPLVDIAQSPAPNGPRLITQTEFNVHFRGFASAEASHVYEHAVRSTPRVRLTPEERSAIVRYYGDEEAAVDAYLQQDPQPLYRRQELATHTAALQRALTRLPGYTGRVYRGAMVPTALLEGLQVGQNVRIPAFVRASGDRGVSLQQLEGRDVPADQVPVVLDMQMRNGAHAIGLHSMRDEAEVIIDSGRVFRVVATHPGDLQLEELGLARQAFGQGTAINLRLG